MPLLPDFSPTTFTFIEHGDHFYEFVFHQSSRLAINEWYRYVEAIYQLPKHTQVSLLIDVRESGDQPLGYALQKAKALDALYPNRPNPIYTVFLNEGKESPLLKLLRAFVQLLGKTDQLHYFDGEKRDEAIAWLKMQGAVLNTGRQEKAHP